MEFRILRSSSLDQTRRVDRVPFTDAVAIGEGSQHVGQNSTHRQQVESFPVVQPLGANNVSAHASVTRRSDLDVRRIEDP